jgi:hypothetical protein
MTKLGEDTVRIVDALFLIMAKQSGGLSIEDRVNGSWDLFEQGCLRLVTDDDGRVGVEPCDENRAERRTQAKRNRPLVKLKRQMDRAMAS